jgi:hypothetical protein
MATITLLAKARQRRLNAIASLGTRSHSRYEDNIVSIFDYAFDDRAEETKLVAKDNVVAFRSTRTHLVAANDTAAPKRAAA